MYGSPDSLQLPASAGRVDFPGPGGRVKSPLTDSFGQSAGSQARSRCASSLPHLADLSPEQKAAVIDDSPRSLVLAGAGSGKTRVLVARIAHLLAVERVPPQKLLAFSFTRKACAEIAHRLEGMMQRIGGPVTLPQMTFTFNAFAFRLVRRHHRRLGFRSPPSIIDESIGAGLLEAFSSFLDDSSTPRPPGSPAEIFRRMRPGLNEIADPHLSGLEESFRAWKIAHGLLELSDQIPLAVELLEGPVGETLRQHLDVVLVDEFQDIDEVQHRLFELLLGPNTSFTLYGDDDQAIYRWRGSNPELIRAYHRRSDVTTHLLTVNYRCRESILAVASDVVAGDPGRVAKPANAFRMGGPKPVCAIGPHQAQGLARTLRQLHEAGRPLEALAVLVRDQFDGRVVKNALRKVGLAVSEDLERPGVRLLTYHGSKGLEFPVVFLPFLDHMKFPNRKLLEREKGALRRRLENATRAARRLKRLELRLAYLEHRPVPLAHRGLKCLFPRFRSWLEALWYEYVRRGKKSALLRALETERDRRQEEAAWLPGLEKAWAGLEEEQEARLAEERRLCYVAMTRAQDELWLSCARRPRCSEFLRDVTSGRIRWQEDEVDRRH